MRVARKKQSHKKNRFVGAIITIGITLLVCSLVSQQVEIYHRRKELSELVKSVEQQRIENKDVERYAQSNDEEYKERVAREKLDFVYPDEVIFKDVSGK